MFQPLRSGVLLKPLASPVPSASGLILATQVSTDAEVIAIGPEVKELKVGDRVKYDTKAVVKLDHLLLCREADILCVVVEE